MCRYTVRKQLSEIWLANSIFRRSPSHMSLSHSLCSCIVSSCVINVLSFAKVNNVSHGDINSSVHILSSWNKSSVFMSVLLLLTALVLWTAQIISETWWKGTSLDALINVGNDSESLGVFYYWFWLPSCWDKPPTEVKIIRGHVIITSCTIQRRRLVRRKHQTFSFVVGIYKPLCEFGPSKFIFA
jgi:hypothetical protein